MMNGGWKIEGSDCTARWQPIFSWWGRASSGRAVSVFVFLLDAWVGVGGRIMVEEVGLALGPGSH